MSRPPRREGAPLRWAILALAIAILAAPLLWRLTEPEGPRQLSSGPLAERVAMLEAELEYLRDELRDLRREALRRPAPAPAPTPLPELAPDLGDFGGFADLMLLSARRDINKGLSLLSAEELRSVFGRPFDELGQRCVAPREGRLAEMIETREVGPFRARLIRPALDSLERVFRRAGEDYPQLIEELRSYGAFCARLVRGSQERISRHAYGLAIDVSVGGRIDAMGDGKTQLGLIILSDYFQEEGWIWGAAFGREDSMHFEVSGELFRRWRDEGLL